MVYGTWQSSIQPKVITQLCSRKYSSGAGSQRHSSFVFLQKDLQKDINTNISESSGQYILFFSGRTSLHKHHSLYII